MSGWRHGRDRGHGPTWSRGDSSVQPTGLCCAFAHWPRRIVLDSPCPPALLVTVRVLELTELAAAGNEEAQARLAQVAELLEGSEDG
jgi:hypothetical protein